MLERLRMAAHVPDAASRDHLFVGTDRFMYFTVSWDPDRKCLRTETALVDQADKASRDSEAHDRCLLDPSLRFMALLLYEGIVTVVPLSKKQKGKMQEQTHVEALADPIPTRISDFGVRSAVFLYPRPFKKDKCDSQIAFLSETSQLHVRLTIRTLKYSAGTEPTADLEESCEEADCAPDLGASHLIAVPAPLYGVLVLAEKSITYYAQPKDTPMAHMIEDPIPFVAWTAIDDFRWVLGDDFGKLYLLMLQYDEHNQACDIKLDLLGTTSRASTLVYLDSGVVFVGSHQGDSQLIVIEEGAIRLLQTIPNIAPVLDFTIMDMGNRAAGGQSNEYSSGQARIVTGSGVFNDGSLRSVRSGVGLEELGILAEMALATRMFALKSRLDQPFDDVLVVSFVAETRVFTFDDDGGVEEQSSYRSLNLSQPTLLALNLPNGRIMQITTRAALSIDASGDLEGEWTEPAGRHITAASSDGDVLALAIDATDLLIFDLNLHCIATRAFVAQISSLLVSRKHCYVGSWRDASITLLDSANLHEVSSLAASDDAACVPRSMEMVNVLSSSAPTLFVAMANGEVVTFSTRNGIPVASSRRAVILGTQQVTLKVLPKPDGLQNVFATGKNPSLIYGTEGRLVFSAVTAEKAVCVCPFHSNMYPNAVALATAEDIRISALDMIPTTHVHTLHVGELVRRIAYSSNLKTFGMGTVRRYVNEGQERVQSRFRLTDEVTFKLLDSVDLKEEELVESVTQADLDVDESDDRQERFVVGTSYADDSQDEAVRGRILVFAVTTERKLKLVSELAVKGACRTLGCLDGKLVAGLVKTVVVYALRTNQLEKLCTYRTSTAPIDLAIHPASRQLAVADLMKSVSVVTYHPPDDSSDTHRLIETGRHIETVWTTAVAHITTEPHHTWLESDAEGNLSLLYQDLADLTNLERRRLKVSCEMRLGEMVNRIRPIDVKISPSAVVLPKAFLATVDGGVYLFGLINDKYLDLLMRLQEALAPHIDSLGHVPFAQFRAYKTQVRESAEPFRFVDGEMVEAFLEMAPSLQQSVVDALGPLAEKHGGVSGVCDLVDSLRRLH